MHIDASGSDFNKFQRIGVCCAVSIVFFSFLCFVYFSFPFLVCFPCSFHAPAVSLILYMCCCWVVCYVCVLIFCSTLLSLVVVMFLCSLCATFVYAFLLWEHA